MSNQATSAVSDTSDAKQDPGTPAAAPAAIREIRASDIDVSVRHQTIMAAIDALGPGEAVRLHVDHEPKPLYYMLQAERPGQVSWEPERSGPTEWIVVVRRLSGPVG